MAVLSLRSSSDFDAVFKYGKRIRTGIGQMIIRITNGDQKIGIVASRKLGNAVIRNRIKRVIRESFRELADSVGPVELVFLPTPDCANLKVPEVVDEMKAAFSKSGTYLNRAQ